MDNEKQVISLTKGKVWKTNFNGKSVYAKKTNRAELENLLKGKKFLKDKYLNINEKIYKIDIPEVYNWNQEANCMIMEECVGSNLELRLREKERREEGVIILHSVLKFMIDNKFYWKDFAPRNIIIGEDIIYLVDFERGLEFEVGNIKDFFRENVYEEYVALLLPEERPISKEKILKISEEENKKIDLGTIHSSRIRRIAQKKKITNEISYTQYMKILDMILIAEEPKRNESGEVIYPIVELEEILEKKGYEHYIKEILMRNNIEIEGERDV